MDDRIDPYAVALTVTGALDALGVPNTIGGSIASSFAGERQGGEASDRQWRDVLAIVRVQADRLDREYLRLHAATLSVSDILSRALGEA